MRLKASFFILIILSAVETVSGQQKPQINIRFSKLLATYDFIQQLSENHPDNKFKQIFESSGFNRQYYKDLIAEMDELNIYESYGFQGYPTGQKLPVMTTYLIEKNLIGASSVRDFRTQTLGIIPNTELFAFSNIISSFQGIYDSLIFLPNKEQFETKVKEIKEFVHKSDIAFLFEAGLNFYNSEWDYSVPFDIAVIPSIKDGGFSAKAFLNNAVSEVPLNFRHNDILFSVLMHEVYHTIYDGQALQVKLNIESWFKQSPSENSQYAYLLLNEALATALGNGYVYEKLSGKTDAGDWYSIKYINMMAKQIYPLVKEYLIHKKQIDQEFVDKYIAVYDKYFSEWTKELTNLLTNRYVIADNPDDLNYFRENYPYSSIYQSEIPISRSSLERMMQTPVTKLVIVSSENKNKLDLVKSAFPELTNWQFNGQEEFVYTTTLKDKTKLIIVNSLRTKLEELFENGFKNNRIE